MKAIIAWLAQTFLFSDIELPNITALMVVIIVLFTALSLCYFGWHFLRVWLALDRAVKLVGSVKAPLLARDYPRLDEFFRSQSILAAAWNEFDETLDKPDPVREPDLPVQNSKQSEDFINQRTIFAHAVNMDFCAAVPGLLTALGLLGTFVSIFAALSLLNLENGQVSEIQPFINNLAGKFVSSIFGIGGAFVFLISEKLLLGGLNSKCHALQNSLNVALTLKDHDAPYVELIHRMDRIAVTLDGLVNKLPAHIEEAVEQSIGQKVGELLNINRQIRQLTEQNLKQREESLTKLVANVVRSFRDALMGSANDDFARLAAGLTSAAGAASQIDRSMSALLKQYEATVKQQCQQMDAFRKHHEGKTHSFSQQQQQRWEEFLSLYQQQVAKLGQLQAEQMETQMRTLQSACEELLRAFEGSASAFQEKVNARVETLTLRIEQSSESQSKEIRALVDYILSGVDNWAGTAQGGLTSVLLSAEQSAGKVQQVVESIDAGLKTVGATVGDLKELEAAINSNSSVIRGSSRELEQLSLSVSSALAELRLSIDAQSNNKNDGHREEVQELNV